MTAEWAPIFALPNIPLATAIGCDIAAIAPAHDCRVAALKRTHPNFRDYLNRFEDNFGQEFEPTVLVLNLAAPPVFSEISALASFRDLIALASVIHGRTAELRHPRGHRVLFSEAFAIYPWMLDQDYEGLVGRTLAIRNTREISGFKGQSSPHLFRTPLGESDIDQPLLDALMARWRRLHEAQSPEWRDVALMRSLNMAYHASLLPAGIDPTFYDIGRIVSLWVSAFEILVHPGGDGRANRDKVFELIERTKWAITESEQLALDTGGKTKVKRTLASWLYQKLHNCRNDFVHGNHVEQNDLLIPSSRRTIFEYAAPLYRVALTAFLGLEYDVARPSIEDIQAVGAHSAKRMRFMEHQVAAEEALLTATRP